jgi:hypothetical protein
MVQSLFLLSGTSISPCRFWSLPFLSQPNVRYKRRNELSLRSTEMTSHHLHITAEEGRLSNTYVGL